MKKQLTATVTKHSSEKTVRVEVVRRWKHPVYKKTITRRKNYLTHCEIKVKPGDKVIIEENKPVSKKKRWQIIKKI